MKQACKARLSETSKKTNPATLETTMHLTSTMLAESVDLTKRARKHLSCHPKVSATHSGKPRGACLSVRHCQAFFSSKDMQLLRTNTSASRAT